MIEATHPPGHLGVINLRHQLNVRTPTGGTRNDHCHANLEWLETALSMHISFATLSLDTFALAHLSITCLLVLGINFLIVSDGQYL